MTEMTTNKKLGTLKVALAAAVCAAGVWGGSLLLADKAVGAEAGVRQKLAKRQAKAKAAEAEKQVQQLIDRGLEYLKTQQKEDGGWQGEKDPPAITAIVLKAFVQDDK